MYAAASSGTNLCGIEPREPDLQSGVDTGEKGHVNMTLSLHTREQCLHGDEECRGVGILVVLNYELCRNLDNNNTLKVL